MKDRSGMMEDRSGMMEDPGHTLPLRLVLPLLSVYLVIGAIGLYNHELWLDEAQHFLIGRDSDSLSALYYNMRYDGHPRLWDGLLYLVTHYISSGYGGLQVLHLVISGSALFVFLRYAPFGVLTKIIIISGYYFLFEYSVLSRNYALGILFLFICCVLLRDPVRNQWKIGAMLVLLCNTHLFFAFAAIGIFISLLPVYLRNGRWRMTGFALFTGLFLAGLILVILQTRTPVEDNCYPVRPGEWLSSRNLIFAASGLVKGWLPIPRLSDGRFWNTFWLDTLTAPVRIALFVFFLLFPAILIRKSSGAIVFYYSGVGLLFAFLVVTQLSATRYFGMVYIYFLSACWMAENGSVDVFSSVGTPVRTLAGAGTILRVIGVGAWGVLYGILFLYVIFGVYALGQDLTRPFSQSHHTVQYLQTHGLTGQAIAVDGYNAGPVISAYLGKRVYYLDIGEEGSYCYFKKSNFPDPRMSIGKEIAQSAFLDGLDRFILVSNRQIDNDSTGSRGRLFQFILLDSFQHAMVLSENYFIYQAVRREAVAHNSHT